MCVRAAAAWHPSVNCMFQMILVEIATLLFWRRPWWCEWESGQQIQIGAKVASENEKDTHEIRILITTSYLS